MSKRSVLSPKPELIRSRIARNWSPHAAIAEFVDNAVESFLENRTRLSGTERHKGGLRVKVEIDTGDKGFVRVSDDAAGISKKDWSRALRPAEPPPSGRLSDLLADHDFDALRRRCGADKEDFADMLTEIKENFKDYFAFIKQILRGRILFKLSRNHLRALSLSDL